MGFGSSVRWVVLYGSDGLAGGVAASSTSQGKTENRVPDVYNDLPRIRPDCSISLCSLSVYHLRFEQSRSFVVLKWVSRTFLSHLPKSHYPDSLTMAIQSNRTEVLLFGAGSIGAVYLYQLQQAGCEITAVCRSNYAFVKQNGFKLSSTKFGNVNYHPSKTVCSVSDCADEIFDYILVCAKSFPSSKPSLPDMLAPAIRSQHTAIVLAQNGINIEEEVAQAFPDNPLLSGVVYLPAIQTGPGVIEYPEMLNLLELGTTQPKLLLTNAVRLGQRYNLKMPRLETLYALLNGRFHTQLRERDGKSDSRGAG